MTTLEKGHNWEQFARDWLEQRGVRFLAQNFRTPGGEIDLIMRDRAHLAFIEVRYRKHTAWASAAETVHLRKQQKLWRTAQHYLQRHPHHQREACRFDVIAIDEQQGQIHVEWIQNAFQL